MQDFTPYQAAQPQERFQIVGTSGTVTTVAASHLGLKRYDRTKVDGLRMTIRADRQGDPFLSGDGSGRAACRSADRAGPPGADHVGGGDPAGVDALLADRPAVVADRGLREGLLYAQMSADGVLEDGPFKIRRAWPRHPTARTHPGAASAT